MVDGDSTFTIHHATTGGMSGSLGDPGVVIHDFLSSHPGVGYEWFPLSSPYKVSNLVSSVDPRSDQIKEVRVDIPRTFSSLPYFKAIHGPQRTESILTAYLVHNPGVGYVQGMNSIAGFLLLVSEVALPEETRTVRDDKVFFTLATIVESERYNKGYYTRTEDMWPLKVDFIVLEHLLSEFLPDVFSHIMRYANLRLYIAAVLASKWFMTVFVDELPLETLLWVWDLHLGQGFCVLFCVAISLFEGCSAKISQAEDLQVITVIQEYSHTVSHVLLLETPFFRSLSKSVTAEKISRLRRKIAGNPDTYLAMWPRRRGAATCCCDSGVPECSVM
jgi:hypothetical protein